jgi:hypothetical protein
MAKFTKLERTALETPNARTRLFQRLLFRRLKKETSRSRQAARMEAVSRRTMCIV